MAGHACLRGRGVEGVGLGMGRQQMYFLPEAHTDFIFPRDWGRIRTNRYLLYINRFFYFVFQRGGQIKTGLPPS